MARTKPKAASMVEITESGTHLEQLEALALRLAAQIDDGDDSHSMAQLARQYRETVSEIDALRTDGGGDALDGILGG